MQMYHPDKYNSHNKALERFCSVFNETANKEDKTIYMKPSEIENFIEDGEILYIPTGQKILYDFEKRNSYYMKCGFPFEDFGQFERKIEKSEIYLSIQCSKDEKCFCIAWHEDFKKEQIHYIGSATSYGNKEYSGKRFTKSFLEIKYTEMKLFYNILLKAFINKTFNSSCFNL